MLSAEGNDSNHYPVLLIVDDAVTKCLPPAVFANEAVSYLAHKMDASLVFFSKLFQSAEGGRELLVEAKSHHN